MYLGHTINISGKNRFLGELLYQESVNYALTGHGNLPLNIVNEIDGNIKALSEGGVISGPMIMETQNQITVMQIPQKFSNDLDELVNSWSAYKQVALSEMNLTNNNDILNNQEFENKKSDFISSANKITGDLSNYSKEQVQNMTLLQITLLSINIIIHLLLLRIILKLVREDQTRKTLLQQITNENQKLKSNITFALVQKSICEAFIGSIENKLHKLNEQVNLMREGKDFVKNNNIIRETFQNLFDKIQQLAQTKIELENEKTYYESLIKNIKNVK